MQVMPASCRASTPPGRTMRRCALSEAPPAPHGEAAWSSTTPTTSVAAPNPWTVPVPVASSSTMPRFGVTETGVAVKVAWSLPSSLVLAWALACRPAAIPAVVAAAAASVMMNLRIGFSLTFVHYGALGQRGAHVHQDVAVQGQRGDNAGWRRDREGQL